MGYDSEIVGAIIGPLLTSLLAIVAYSFQQWRTRRRWEDERNRAIEQAIQEVQYIDTWLSALQRIERIDPDHELKLERALLDLERSYQVMSLDLADDEPRPSRRTLAQHIGWFLLVPIHGSPAKVVRVFYWIMLSLTLIWVIAIMASVTDLASDGIAVTIIASVILTALSAVPTILVAVLARHLERRTLRQREIAQPGSPPPFTPFQVPATGFPDPRSYPPPGPQAQPHPNMPGGHPHPPGPPRPPR